MQSDTPFSFHSVADETIERNRDQVLRCRAYRDGVELVAPTAATVTVTDASGTVVLDGVAATITDGEAHYTLTAAATASKALGEGWLIRWLLTLDGIVREHRLVAALVRTKLHCPVIVQDLFDRDSALDTDAAKKAIHSHGPDFFASKIAIAWRAVDRRLRRGGRRPYLVLSSAECFEVTTTEALALCYDDLGRRIPAYKEVAADYRTQNKTAWDDLMGALFYDESDDGLPQVDDEGGAETELPEFWL